MELTRCTATYKISSAKRALKFFVFSDLHINKNSSRELLPAIISAASKIQPDYIFFLGDLVHTTQFLDTENNARRLQQFLDDLAKIAPLYMITGNHDIRSYDEENDLAFVKELTEFWEQVERNPRITVLRNQEVETEDFYLAGMEQSAECYGLNRAGGTNKYQRNILIGEKPEAMRKEMTDFLKKIHPPKEHSKPNILLLHSARFLGWREMGKWVDNFDLIMSGHLHNLGMPPKAFRGVMKAYGLGRKKGHFVCPPISTFVNPKYQKRYKRYYGIVKIVKEQPKKRRSLKRQPSAET